MKQAFVVEEGFPLVQDITLCPAFAGCMWDWGENVAAMHTSPLHNSLERAGRKFIL